MTLSPSRSLAILRQWPLSGVLADLDDPPLAKLDFDSSEFLAALYAERLSRISNESWTPPAGGKVSEHLALLERSAKSRGRKPKRA